MPLDAHGCPACPHPAIGPAIEGSRDVNVNKRPALRVDDPGIHMACCGTNTWTATKGSLTVFINGKGAHRMGDQNRHCGGMGQLIEGSPNVIVGEDGGGAGAGGRSSAVASDRRGGGSNSSGSGSDGGGSDGSGTGAGSSGDISRAVASVDPELTTVVIELRQCDDSPCSGQQVVLATPGGAPRSGAIGDDAGPGTVVFRDVEPGPCEVSFPGLDQPPPGPIPAEADPVDGPAEVRLSRRTTESFWIEGPGPHVFRLERLAACVFELEHYHPDGAVVLPGAAPTTNTGVTGIDVLAAALVFGETSGKLALVTGHAALLLPDGGDLSQARADSALLALRGDRAEWAAAAAATHAVRDYQSVLQWIEERFGWGTAVAPSGDFDDATRAALTQFRAHYNQQFAPPIDARDVDEAGRAGAATWAALFDLYDRALAAGVGGADRLRALRDELPLVGDAAPSAPPELLDDGGPPHGGRPPHLPFLRIRPDNSTWPAKLAEQATGDAARYITDLNPLNPHLVHNGQWKAWIVPGDEINLPASYEDALAPYVAKEHYDIYPRRRPGPPPAPARNAVGCGARHLGSPQARDPARRTGERRSEIAWFADGEVPRHVCDGPRCDPATCELYDPRQYGLAYQPVDALVVPDVALVDPRWEQNEVAPGRKLVTLCLLDLAGRAAADLDAVVVAGDERCFAHTDGHGRLTVEIAAALTAIAVRYAPDDAGTLVELPVALALPPVSDDAGAIARLVNLGYAADRDRDHAVYAFQADRGISASGVLDDATRAALAALHDGA